MKLTTTLAGALAASTCLAGMAAAQTELTMWYHGGGNEVESNILDGIVSEFNAAQSDWMVTVESFPQGSYNDSVVAAALAGNLPCILDVDGPVMPNWAWAGYMQALPISEAALEGHLDATIGRYNGEVYSVGLWDAAVAMYTRQSTLDALGVRTPSLEEPWTLEEFNAALAAAKASGDFEYAFDVGMAWTGEWYPYAFSPFLQSFGGDIVDRSTDLTAE
ncbi:MAG: ABC transporter substrate-binding protein, partial [Paracoccaceae bacterium]|nr:ABC transporter substrate-binding protein [Paracoccaceae bacterium]